MEGQKIKCSVYDCKYCKCDCDSCKLESIKICNCSDIKTKEGTMCNDYKKKEK